MASAFFNEDHESIREMAKQFAEGSLAAVAGEIDKSNEFPEEIVQEMAELGSFPLRTPCPHNRSFCPVRMSRRPSTFPASRMAALRSLLP